MIVLQANRKRLFNQAPVVTIPAPPTNLNADRINSATLADTSDVTITATASAGATFYRLAVRDGASTAPPTVITPDQATPDFTLIEQVDGTYDYFMAAGNSAGLSAYVELPDVVIAHEVVNVVDGTWIPDDTNTTMQRQGGGNPLEKFVFNSDPFVFDSQGMFIPADDNGAVIVPIDEKPTEQTIIFVFAQEVWNGLGTDRQAFIGSVNSQFLHYSVGDGDPEVPRYYLDSGGSTQQAVTGNLRNTVAGWEARAYTYRAGNTQSYYVKRNNSPLLQVNRSLVLKQNTTNQKIIIGATLSGYQATKKIAAIKIFDFGMTDAQVAAEFATLESELASKSITFNT